MADTTAAEPVELAHCDQRRVSLSFVSLFAGIGGFDLGFERARFEPRGMCEIDPHAQAVLRRHWPNVPLHGDITTLKGDAFGPAEVVVWGSPCQGLSLAGRRAGLEDERSALFTEGIRFIRELRHATDDQYPRFSVWENVPGALSSAAGRDFRAVLEAFLEAEVPMPRSGKWANAGVVRGNGREVAWRVLDSQHFGVAQRRRRVFVVADFGGHGAAEILFEREGVPGHPPQGRAPGQGITGALTGGAGSSSAGNPDDNRAQAGFLVPVKNGTDPIAPVAFALRGRDDGAVPEVSGDKASALRGAAGGSSRDMVAYAATDYSTGSFAQTDHAGPLTGTPDRTRAATIVNPVTYAVRRLTPRECERLQAFPDDHTRYDHEGREIADAHRYRLLGNAVTVSVANWIAHRIRQAARRELGE